MVETIKHDGYNAYTRYYNGGNIDVNVYKEDNSIVFPGDVYYVDEIDDLIEILQQIKKDKNNG